MPNLRPKKARFFFPPFRRGRFGAIDSQRSRFSNSKLGPKSNESRSFGHLGKKKWKEFARNLQLHLWQFRKSTTEKKISNTGPCAVFHLRTPWYGFSTLLTGDLARRLACYTSMCISVSWYTYSTGNMRLPVRCQETRLVIHLPRYLLATSAAHVSLMVLRPVLLHRRM